MQQSSATRPFNLLVVLGALGLAVSVFAWGMQYKLSLYDPPASASHKIPEAKLLARDERSGIAEGPLVARTKTSTRVSDTIPTAIFILLLALSILNPQATGQRELAHESFVAYSSRAIECFLRSPPSHPRLAVPPQLKTDAFGLGQLAGSRVAYSPPADVSRQYERSNQ